MILTVYFIQNAQKIGPVTISLGKPIPDDQRHIAKIAGEANDKIYVLAIKDKKYFIKTFSKDFNLLKTSLIDKKKIQTKNDKLNFEDIFVIQNKVYVFVKIYDRKAKTLNLYALPVSKEGVLQYEKKLIMSVKVPENLKKGKFFIKETPRNDKLLILYGISLNKQKLIEYELEIIDGNLKEMMRQKEKVSFKNRKNHKYHIADFDMDLDENVYLVVNESYRDKNKKQRIEKLFFHSYKKDNNYKKEAIEIDIKDKSIAECKMLATSKGIVHLAGLYAGVSKKGHSKRYLQGIYSASIDINANKLNKIVFTPFDYKIKSQLLGPKKAKKDKGILPFYKIHTLIEEESGGLILISEYQHIFQGTSMGSGSFGMTTLVYEFYNVIITSFNPDGTVKWIKIVPKKQRATHNIVDFDPLQLGGYINFVIGAGLSMPLVALGKNPGYLGVLPVYSNHKLMLIYNDLDKNKGVTDISKINKLNNFKNTILSLFIFDENGNAKRIDRNYSKDSYILKPEIYYLKTNEEYIINSSNKKNDKLGRLILNKKN